MSKKARLNVDDFSLDEMKFLIEGAKKYMSPPEYVEPTELVPPPLDERRLTE